MAVDSTSDPVIHICQLHIMFPAESYAATTAFPSGVTESITLSLSSVMSVCDMKKVKVPLSA